MKIQRKVLITLSICCYVNVHVVAQTTTDTVTYNGRRKLHLDLPALKEIYTNAHPIFSRPGIREQFSAKIDSLYNADSTTHLLDLIRVLGNAPTAGLCRDAHNTLSVNDIDTGLLVWPLPVRMIANKIYCNQQTAAIPFGAEILSINGLTTATIIDRLNLKDAVSMEASANMESGFFYMLKELLGVVPAFQVQYRMKTQTGTIALPAVTVSDYVRNYDIKRAWPNDNWKKSNQAPAYDYVDTLYKTSILYFNTFKMNSADCKKYLNEVFARINQYKLENLVIDLSQNKGGEMETAIMLYSYLTARPFDSRITARKETYQVSLPYLIAINGQFASNLADSAVKYKDYFYDGFTKEGDHYTKKIFPDPVPAADSSLRFRGKVYILTSKETFSAACLFASLAKVNNRATLIGTPTTGSAHTFTALSVNTYILPETGMFLDLPFAQVEFDFAKALPGNVCDPIYPDIALSKEDLLQEFLNPEETPARFKKVLEVIQARK